MLLAIKYGLLASNEVEVALGPIGYGLLILGSMCIAAGGNIINDIEDRQIDAINRPSRPLVTGGVTEKAAYTAYIVLNCLGVGIGFYMANWLGKPGLSVVFIAVAALLYFYSTQLSNMAIVGNLSVSLLVAVAVLLPVLFDIFPAIKPQGIDLLQQKATLLILLFAAYAFYINLVRELIKDIQDVDGDHSGGRNSLPIIIGRHRTRWVAFWMMVLVLLTTLSLVYFMNASLQYLALYFMFGLGGLMLVICIQLYHAKKPKDLSLISNLLKALLFMGLLGFVLFPLELMRL